MTGAGLEVDRDVEPLFSEGGALPFDGSATPAFFNVKGGSLGWVNLFSRCLLSIVRMTTMI